MVDVPADMSKRLNQRLEQSEELLLWTHACLNDMRLPALESGDKIKRARIGGGCWMTAIEHSQAIVVLVGEGLYGSALALIRPMFDAFVRGRWILFAAQDEAVDDAGRDKFPRDFAQMLRELEPIDTIVTPYLAKLKAENWETLCSFTHTGYQQIGARLTPAGLGHNFDEDHMIKALGWADFIAIMLVGDFSSLAGNQQVLSEALAKAAEPGISPL